MCVAVDIKKKKKIVSLEVIAVKKYMIARG